MIYTVTESTTNRAFKFVIHNNGKSKIRRFDQYYNVDYRCNMYGNYHLNKIKKNHEPCE